VARDFTGISKSTASKTVSIALANLQQYVKTPETPEKIKETKNSLIAGFLRYIETIDCNHIRIQSPDDDDAKLYRNQKGFFSLNVQTIADANIR